MTTVSKYASIFCVRAAVLTA